MTTQEQYDYIVLYLKIHDDCGDGFSLSNEDYFIDIMGYINTHIDQHNECLWVFLLTNKIERLYYIYSPIDIWLSETPNYSKVTHSLKIILLIYNILIHLDKESTLYAMTFAKLNSLLKLIEIDRQLKAGHSH